MVGSRSRMGKTSLDGCGYNCLAFESRMSPPATSVTSSSFASSLIVEAWWSAEEQALERSTYASTCSAL